MKIKTFRVKCNGVRENQTFQNVIFWFPSDIEDAVDELYFPHD